MLMAEMKFNCPHCSQPIACDELWGGHQIQCPICNKELMVPMQGGGPAEAAPSLVPKVPTSAAPKLSISQAAHKPATPPPQPPPGAAPARTVANMSKERKKEKSNVMKYVWIVVFIGALGAAAFFAWPTFKKWQDKSNAENDGTAAKNSNAVAAASAKTNAASFKTAPLAAPDYSLDPSSATIPECRVNGKIGGTNFVVETVRLESTPAAQILRFFHGPMTAPDHEIMIYLRLKAGEKLAGHEWTITPEMKGTGVPTLTKRWKADPRYAPRLQNYSTGYALKLELGQMSHGLLTGKVFVALPDPEKSVIAGVFEAATTLPDSPAPAATAPAPSKTQNAAGASATERQGIGL
jgi:hypothetical protein